MRGQSLALQQLRRVDKQQARQAGYVSNSDTYQFLISPTCPPSTSVHMRGGLCWWGSSAIYGYGWYVPTYTIDLTDSDKVSVRGGHAGYTYTFTNPYWYAPAIIVAGTGDGGLYARDEWPTEVPDEALYIRGTINVSPYLEEFETYAEAEDRLGNSRQLELCMGYGVPTTSIILRNNGNILSPNQYMEVDKINRGRSYLFRYCKQGWEAQ